MAAAGQTVTVGCRLPTGLYMQIFELETQKVDRPDGTQKEVKVAVAKSQRVKLNGAAKFRGGGKEMAHDIRHGAGLTFGVDADLFAAWMKANADTEIVKNGLVFAHRTNDIEAQAKDHRAQRTGLEPLDSRNLPDEFKGKVETKTA